MAEPKERKERVVLEARDISVARDGVRVLHGVSFQVRSCELLSVLGPNGAGKSTLLRACAGLLPYDGNVALGAGELRTLSAKERAQRLAFVPQQTSLRSALPVREVVAQGRYMHRVAWGRPSEGDGHAIDEALETCDVSRFAERAFTKLSFGEQRRVLIARALASGARTLLLDEPTAALDVQHVLRLHALLLRLARAGYAVVVVLHSLDDARRFTDRALLLDQGRIVHEGAVSEVISSKWIREVYRVEVQAEGALRFDLPESTSESGSESAS